MTEKPQITRSALLCAYKGSAAPQPARQNGFYSSIAISPINNLLGAAAPKLGFAATVGDYDDGRSHWVLHVATAVGLPLSAYIVAASLYFATTIPYSSDFFCDG